MNPAGIHRLPDVQATLLTERLKKDGQLKQVVGNAFAGKPCAFVLMNKHGPRVGQA